MKTTPNHGLSYVEGNDKPADYPLISQENMTKLDTLIQQLIDGKAPLSHNHSIGQIMGLTEDLAAKADHQATAAALAGKASSSHTHTMEGITGLVAALAAKANQAAVDTALAQKANTSHTHTQADITGLTAALAGKAPTTHTHTMGQVTGLDTALAGKANQTTLDTRVPSTLALRLDTTVGTRIFAGNTMIYGDTGWRDISANIRPEWTGWARIKRDTHEVRVLAYLTATEALIGQPRSTRRRLLSLPAGFYSTATLAYRSPGNGSQNGIFIPIDMAYALNMLDIAPSDVNIGLWTGATFTVNHVFPVDSPWPNTLPGIPV